MGAMNFGKSLQSGILWAFYAEIGSGVPMCYNLIHDHSYPPHSR